MLTKEKQIAERARKHQHTALHNLHGFIDKRVLLRVYGGLKKWSASGVDGQSWESYGEGLGEKLDILLDRFRKGEYRAPHIRRVYIKKENGKMRPLGIPTIEDKVLQGAVNWILQPIYEEEFKEFSYGFRPERSQHQAIEYLFKEVSFGRIRYIIDADIENFFGELEHGMLRSFLDKRVKDGVIRKMIDKWLKAGIMEDEQLKYPTAGTPQGGIISPLLSNIYLHYVLDEWFSEVVQPLLKGRSMIVRYADDFVLGFSNLEDANRVYRVLGKRFGKYGLRLHAEKTKIVDLENREKHVGSSFDFLGFTHYLGRSRKGYKILKRKSSRKKFTAAVKRIGTWISRNRDKEEFILIAELNVKLRGYYNYYGVTFNSRGVERYYVAICRLLHKWLNRRGGRRRSWEYYNRFIKEWCPVLKPKIYHSFTLAKP